MLTRSWSRKRWLPHRCRFEISARGEYADGGAVGIEEPTRTWTFAHPQESAPAP